jgi:hypothetical protein
MAETCRGCGATITPTTHPVLGGCWADADGKVGCSHTLLAAHEPAVAGSATPEEDTDG